MFSTTTKTSESEFPSMDSAIIAANTDILSEILLRLPVKPLFRFKCVSKNWRSLITNSHFCRRKSHNVCKKITGLYILRRKMLCIVPVYYSVPLNKIREVPSFTSLVSVDEEPMKILQSCNGLLCCQTGGNVAGKYNYYICNPTTHQFRKLPYPVHADLSMKNGITSVLAVLLAFDPRKSPHYKVLCVYSSQTDADQVNMELYSSQTGQWRSQNAGDHLKMEGGYMLRGRLLASKFNFRKGVYWNGSIHWLNLFNGDGLYFNAIEEQFGKFPMLPLQKGRKQRIIKYFAESHDHLLLVELNDPCATQFDLYEMNREYTEWFIRCHVDVEVVLSSSLNPKQNWAYYNGFEIISVVWDRNEEDSFVVLGIPGKAVRFNLGDSSFRKIWDLSTTDDLLDTEPIFWWSDAFHYIESVSSV